MNRNLIIIWLLLNSTLLKGQSAQQFEDCILPYVKSNNFSGTVYVAKAGKVLFHKSFGLAVREWKVPNTNQTVYHLASVSKPFTSTAVLMLEQAGKLKVTDPLSLYFPDFKDGNKITLHHLLTHTSGVTNINNMPQYDQMSLSPVSLDSIISVFKNLPLRFEPGSNYEYSNSNYNLLARIVEKVSGVRFGEYLDREIFKKLGMMNTQHNGDSRQIIDRLAPGYAESGRTDLIRAPFLEWSIKTGNGSLVSSVEDLALFEQSFYTDKLLSSANRERMFTKYKNDTGYGWYLRQNDDRIRAYMSGRSPGYSAFLARYPNEKICIVVLSNIYVPVASEIGNKLAAVALGKTVENRRLEDQVLNEKEASSFAGKYKFGADFFRPNAVVEVRSKDGKLTTDFGDLIRDHDGVFILRSFWSEIQFQAVQGKVAGLTFDGTKAERVD